MKYPVRIVVNGQEQKFEVDARTLLVDLLRESLDLTGTRVACDTGTCGACTVLLDGGAVKSCSLLAVQADGATITTVEGLTLAPSLGAGSAPAEPGERAALETVLEAVAQRETSGCGYCAPGLALVALDLLREPPEQPGAEGMLRAVGAHVCRCGGHRDLAGLLEAARPLVEAPGETAAGPQGGGSGHG